MKTEQILLIAAIGAAAYFMIGMKKSPAVAAGGRTAAPSFGYAQPQPAVVQAAPIVAKPQPGISVGNVLTGVANQAIASFGSDLGSSLGDYFSDLF